MNDKYFIDTNILIYSVDNQEMSKRNRSLEIISKSVLTGTGIISWQVVQEFLNVATRKFDTVFKPQDLNEYLKKILNPLCQIYPDFNLYQDSLRIMNTTNYSYYDSLIIASAVKGECTILYSEDFQAGQKINGVRIVNPFS